MHAKNTVDITYVARAETHGAEVRPLHLATGLEPPARAGGSWRVAFRDLDERRRRGASRRPPSCSPPARSARRGCCSPTGSAPAGLSPALGSRFSGNGDALGIAFDPSAADVQGARNDFGPVMTSKLDYTAERRLIVADGGLPASFDVLLDVARGVDVIRGWRRWLLRLRDARGASSAGATRRCARATCASPRTARTPTRWSS